MELLDSHLFDSIGRGPTNTIKFDLVQTEMPMIFDNKYEYLIITSGYAHVLTNNDTEKLLHHKINFIGTKKLVESAYHSGLKGIVFVSTVAVYGEKMKLPFKEEDELLGEAPYAKSKIAAEAFLMEWSRQNNVPVLILRIPLIAGKCPPGNLGAMIEAIRNKRYFSIAKGKAKRSMVLAEDIAKFIVDNCGQHGIYNLCDGIHPSYRELEQLISKQLNLPPPKGIPVFIAQIFAIIGDIFTMLPINSVRLRKLKQDLILDDSKARNELGWRPRKVVKHFIIK
jgi:nucleoside-diphosphate-sugar epimerase